MIDLSKMQGGRTERRIMTNIMANVASITEPEKIDAALIVNLSEHGARVVTVRQCQAGSVVVISDPQQVFWATGEVVYCQSVPTSQFAIGLKFNEALGLNVLIRPIADVLETQRPPVMMREHSYSWG